MALAPEDNSSYLNMERLKKTQKLIHLYRSYECLWNPQSPGYHSSTVKDDAWRRITLHMKSGLTPDQVKLQILGLRNYYSQECSALQRSQQEGYSYVPRHSYFQDLQFLGNLDVEETNEPKASFSMGQVNDLLDDAFLLEDSTTIRANNSPNFSEAAFFSPLASLSPCVSLTKDGYTFYKMILEPEPPNGEELREFKKRSTSGNDRWYPTTYCVKCKQEEEHNREERGQSRGINSESKSSSDGNQCSCSRARTDECSCSNQSQDKPRNVTNRNGIQYRTQDQIPLPNSRKRYPRTHQNGVFVDLGNWDDGESTNNGQRNDKWPGPRLCSQNRQEWQPRYRKVVPNVPNDDRKSKCGSWKRNNDAICQRLQNQLASQENQSARYSEKGSEEFSAQSQENKNDRRRSGEDQLNAMLLQKKAQKNRNSQNTPIDPAQYNNNQPISNQAYYNTTQPVENQCYCDTNQSNVDPQRCSTYGCQCMYCNRTVIPPQGNYYVTQQIDQNAPNYSRAVPPDNQVGQAQPYGEANYYNEYGQPAYTNQQQVYCINTENAEIWVKDQSAPGAPNPAQVPMAPLSRSWPQETESGLPQPGSQAVSAPPQSLEKIFSSNINKILQPEQPIQHPTEKKRPVPPPRDIKYVECPAYKGVQKTGDQRERLGKGNYQSQRRTNDSEEDSVGGNNQPIRSYDEGNRSRKRQRNQDPDRQVQNQNEERPTQRRSRNDDGVVSNPNSNYEDSPPRRGRDPNGSSNKSKVFQLQTDDSQFIECPAYNRENPKECPSLKCRLDDPSQPSRGERSVRRRRPTSGDRDYDEEETPSSRRRSQGQDRNRPENGDYEEQKQSVREKYAGQRQDDNSRIKGKSDDEAYRSKRRKEENCTDKTCPFRSSTKKYKDRSGREVENPRNGNGNGNYQSSKRKYNECDDYTCPYINSGEVKASPKERSRRQRDQSYPKEYDEEESEARRKYRSESPARRPPRDFNKFEDSEKNQKDVRNYRRTRNEASADIDDSDDNVYKSERYRNDNRNYNKDQDIDIDDADDKAYKSRRYRNDNRDYNKEQEDGVPTERVNKYSRREERNYSSKDNERYQRGYRNGNDYRNNTVDECMCEDDFESDNAYGAYPMRENKYRGDKVSNDYKRTETSRRIKSYDDSENEDGEYVNSDRKNNYRKRYEDQQPFYSRGTDMATSYSRGTDVYESEYDCLCSDNEDPQSSRQNRSNQAARNDQRALGNTKNEMKERTRGNINNTGADFNGNDYPKYENSNSNRAPESSVPKRSRQDNQNSEDHGKNDRDRSNEIDGCLCEPAGGEYYSKYQNGNTNRTPETPSTNKSRKDKQDPNDPGKDDRGIRNDIECCECDPNEAEYSKYEKNSSNQANDNEVSCEDCTCDPNEPKITVGKERNQAGSINALAESQDHKKESSGRPKKPSKTERKEAKTKPVSTSDNQTPTVKKSSRPKTGVFPRVQSRSASPAHLAASLRTQPGEPIKRRTSLRTGGQSSAAKRTMDTHAAANSKLPFDLNSAAYFICKLQDEGNNHQYLLVVPKKPIGPPDGQRMGPGQESVKQLHCQRQCSGFQSMSWVDSSAISQSQPSQPSRPSRPSQQSQTRSGGLSVLGSFRVPPVLASTALCIIKEHLNRSTIDTNPERRLRGPGDPFFGHPTKPMPRLWTRTGPYCSPTIPFKI
ncbi:uncharacterized protein LOC119551687 isoform X3 [Drosophila subpulchrella]|uniref:uncharacterized protein LOC119551687 isoform X3 n=1 Tax=Drosophila subpulchrella TaxID=1486046 RepID=UPI0018A18F49|nr:uncharacterized protein LOC119551687 isoform X3 [Drosophila subpulchrella]